MEVSDCVATALTRARQARLPSPWTEAVDFLDLEPRASKKVEYWRARLLRKTEKIDSLWTGRGSRPVSFQIRLAVGEGISEGYATLERVGYFAVFALRVPIDPQGSAMRPSVGEHRVKPSR